MANSTLSCATGASVGAQFGAPSFPLFKSPVFGFKTSLECDELVRSASAASTMSNYKKDVQRGALVFQRPGASHRVELTQDAPEIGGEEWEMDALERLISNQSADFGFAFFYVCQLLAPPACLPADRFAGGWIDLDDVAAKIGYDVNGFTAAKREEMRAQVWELLKFGARAVVIGQRTSNYRDHATGEIIETRIESPVWRVHDIERPIQTALFGETPRRVQLVISKQWEPLLIAPELAQYLPFAEIVGSLPTNQTGSAWARVLGMALANFWRRLPQQASGAAPAILPTRRELLTHYTPKKMPPLELLASDKPKRAVKYWFDALAILVERDFIAPDGEAARTVKEMLESFGRKGWQSYWLDERVDIRPGSLILPAICERANAKPAHKPRDLTAPKRRARKS